MVVAQVRTAAAQTAVAELAKAWFPPASTAPHPNGAQFIVAQTWPCWPCAAAAVPTAFWRSPKHIEFDLQAPDSSEARTADVIERFIRRWALEAARREPRWLLPSTIEALSGS